MTRNRFKNPMVNNQYKKPACHTDHCFQRHACCNNYRCCVCHCCLQKYQIYSKGLDRCVGNLTDGHIEQRKTTSTTDPLPTKQGRREQFTKENINTKTTKREQTTRTVWREKTKLPLRRSTWKTTTKDSRTHSHEANSTWSTWKPTYKKSQPPSDFGYQNAARDDKTSTIAGVAVALALVAIVAIVVLVVVCSRRKKRNIKKAVKAKASNNDAAVVTIPLTIENVSDKFRDNEEGTTSDTTIDSPITTSVTANGTSNNHALANDTQAAPNQGVGSPKKHGKKHKRSRHAKDKGTVEQKPLCKEHAYQSNGLSECHLQGCDRVPQQEGKVSQCTSNHVLLGAPATSSPNGHHLQDRNGSLKCDV